MNKKFWLTVIGLAAVVALALGGCSPKLGTDKNPIVMSFVPSGDTEEIIASGETLAEMIELSQQPTNEEEEEYDRD